MLKSWVDNSPEKLWLQKKVSESWTVDSNIAPAEINKITENISHQKKTKKNDTIFISIQLNFFYEDQNIAPHCQKNQKAKTLYFKLDRQ